MIPRNSILFYLIYLVPTYIHSHILFLCFVSLHLVEQLCDEERLVREANLYQGHVINAPLSSSDDIQCDMWNRLNIYSRKWNVDKDVLVVNLNRLFTILSKLTLRDFVIKQQQKLQELTVDEWFVILEFYLQMDG